MLEFFLQRFINDLLNNDGVPSAIQTTKKKLDGKKPPKPSTPLTSDGEPMFDLFNEPDEEKPTKPQKPKTPPTPLTSDDEPMFGLFGED